VCVGVFIFSELMTVVMSECVFLFLILQLVDSVALCIRGGCDFQLKATIAQSGGATGVLIINNEEG
jgi:hypothetical protein